MSDVPTQEKQEVQQEAPAVAPVTNPLNQLPTKPAAETKPEPVKAKVVEAEAASNFDLLGQFQTTIKALEKDVSKRDATISTLRKEKDELASEIASMRAQAQESKVRSTITKLLPQAAPVVVDGLIARAGDLARDASKEEELVSFLQNEIQGLQAQVQQSRRVDVRPVPAPRPRRFAL